MFVSIYYLANKDVFRGLNIIDIHEKVEKTDFSKFKCSKVGFMDMRGLFKIKKQLNDPKYKNLECKYPIKEDFINNMEKGYCLTKNAKKVVLKENFENICKRNKVQEFVSIF